MAKAKDKNPIVINIFGALGYIACLLQWLWAVALYIPLLQKGHVFELFVPRPSTVPRPVPTAQGEPSFLLMIIAVAVTIIVLAVTVYALAKIPATIAKTGHKLTHDPAEKFIVPALTHHQKIPAKKKLRLTLAASFAIKGLLLAVPLLLAVFAASWPLPLPYAVVMTAAGFLALLTLFFFGLQLLLVTILRPKTDTVW